jgi:3-oxoacyl-[acyl-carrier protein] reductase
MDLGLKGKKALITGGSKGIGRAVAEMLADEGADVAICARSAGPIAETLSALRTKGVRATGEAIDVGNGEALKSWIERSAEDLGGIDILISNVSAFGLVATPESWQRSFELDMMGMVNAVDAALPFLERSGEGSIVLVSSAAAVEHIKGEGVHPYGAFKAAVTYYAKALANTYAPKGIRVNTVSPGTTMVEGGFWDTVRISAPEKYEEFLGLNPLGRMGRPDEVASAVAFMASGRASYIMGANLIVEGSLCNRVQY